ncbi:glycoside hydrolase domain-containing protein [Atopobium minutum]|uniref:glycoside hydrolase domain-containing protein n=1 Tax=Atopobium minutum TaxID=1381 RepID=UPI00280C3494|nr:glycoside hydrolase domain-containing protein [Atopobium minutum]
MADPMVLRTQQWLNKTYGNNSNFGSVKESGSTGWDTIYGLIRALQIELGITSTANNFGPGTQSRFKARYPNGINDTVLAQAPTSNIYSIVQGALWCKGYPAVYGKKVTQDFTEGMKSSIRTMKKDMGIGGEWMIDLDIMMTLLSMKQFKLLSVYGGKEPIRSIQQTINRSYRGYTDIVPTDGLYGREMNTAMIQVLQKIEGYTPSQATGYFGNGTRSNLKTISSGTSEWVWLANAALVCNGYDAPSSNTWTEGTYRAVHKFQVDYVLPVSHVVDKNTWMSLLTSKGNPDRPCIACDTRFEITDELANRLRADGYKIVGRYLSEPEQDSKNESDYFKALRTGELERIITHGLKYFPILQEYSTRLEHFSSQNGTQHAKKALAAAKRLGVPPTIIYFAVDYDATDPEVSSNIIPYFKAVSDNLGNGYSVGIYASRNICTRVINAGFAEAAFVSDMSTGFSGNLGFPIPKDWVFDQFHEISGYGSKWDLDRVAYSGAYPACSSTSSIQENKDRFALWAE